MEDLIQDMIRRFEASGSHKIEASMLPHHDTVKDFYHAELHAPQLASSGDVIMYLPQLALHSCMSVEVSGDCGIRFSKTSQG